jgi:hypothetical protein
VDKVKEDIFRVGSQATGIPVAVFFQAQNLHGLQSPGEF